MFIRFIVNMLIYYIYDSEMLTSHLLWSDYHNIPVREVHGVCILLLANKERKNVNEKIYYVTSKAALFHVPFYH